MGERRDDIDPPHEVGGGHIELTKPVSAQLKGTWDGIWKAMSFSWIMDRQNVWCAPGANRKGSSANAMLGVHATPKPVELCADAILDVTNRGDTVLDAFLGSGTTLIAAEKTGRRCCGIELEPKFVDVAIGRWQELTGEQAVLAESGETFAQVAARRGADAEHPARAA